MDIENKIGAGAAKRQRPSMQASSDVRCHNFDAKHEIFRLGSLRLSRWRSRWRSRVAARGCGAPSSLKPQAMMPLKTSRILGSVVKLSVKPEPSETPKT